MKSVNLIKWLCLFRRFKRLDSYWLLLHSLYEPFKSKFWWNEPSMER